MFVLDKENNAINKIEPKTFTELGYREREHLQVWLEKNPLALGEELLFIQKEFDGFNDTRERLDLLAIDKDGNLVIVENKLDDTGRDVTWQAMKYASYCSSLSKNQIKEIYQSYLNKQGSEENSETNIVDFLEAEDFSEVQLNQTQRIILVAGNYRKEVTSTVLWLLTKYNMKVQCFKAVPYSFQDQIFLNIEQIIPVKEVEEFTIRMAEKIQEEQFSQNDLKERHKLRFDFWRKVINEYSKNNTLYSSITPSKESWISAGSGMTGVGFNLVITKNYARTEVFISRGNSSENKLIFDKLYQYKQEIEDKTGELIWERLDNKKACRVKQEISNVSLYDVDTWEQAIQFYIHSMMKIEPVFREYLQKINREIKTQE